MLACLVMETNDRENSDTKHATAIPHIQIIPPLNPLTDRQITANGLTLGEVLAGVVLEGDSDFAISDGCSSEGEREGFSSYHRQPELDAEKVTALSRAVKFPSVGAVMVVWPLLMVRRNRIEIQVSIIV